MTTRARSALLVAVALLVLLVSVVVSLPGAGASGAAPTGEIERTLDEVERMLRPLEADAKDLRRFMACIDEVAVSEFGDPDRRFGYVYDERNGTGLEFRPALAIDRRKRGVADYRFLDFPTRDDCESDTTQVGTPGQPGTADPARNPGAPLHARSSIDSLGRRLERLEDRAEAVDRASERFDDWESCLSAVTVTEYGDPDGRFGYLFTRRGADLGYRAAVAIDTSPWDDPDYLLLAFAGRDDPAGPGECGSEPGEAVDRVASPAQEVAEDLSADASSLLEQVEDLGEPIEEFTNFDECVYSLGLSDEGSRARRAGFRYSERERPRPALALDSGRFDDPDYEFLVTPGEEPPSIECNEDASGESTSERGIVP